MRRLVLVSLFVLAVAYVVGIGIFLLPDDEPLPEGADAVVVLAGPDHLLRTGQTLVGGGIAPNLVVSATQGTVRANRRVRFCRSEGEGVTCIYPGPFATSSEAQAITRLARRNRWDTLVLVSSKYERFVAERVFERCGNFRIAEVGVEEPWWRTAVEIPLEWVKLGLAETVRRNC